jgi:hypothetical protein
MPLTAEILTFKAFAADQQGSILLEKSTSINATACATMRQLCATFARRRWPAHQAVPAGDANGRDRGKGGGIDPV